MNQLRVMTFSPLDETLVIFLFKSSRANKALTNLTCVLNKRSDSLKIFPWIVMKCDADIHILPVIMS